MMNPRTVLLGVLSNCARILILSFTYWRYVALYTVNTKQLYSICTMVDRRCTNVIQMFCVSLVADTSGLKVLINIQATFTQRDIHPMLNQCWASVVDAGPTLILHWAIVSCLLGDSH